VVAVRLVQHRVAAGRHRRRHVPLAVAERHRGIGPRVQAQHGNVYRHGRQRVGEPVLLRQFVRPAAHQVERGGLAHAFARGVGQRQHARLRYDPAQRYSRPGTRRTSRPSTRRQLLSPGRPHGQVAARAVPDGDDARDIDRSRQRREEIDPGSHVRERRGPPASGERAPVLQVPDHISLCG
jgi:hypothetical protein